MSNEESLNMTRWANIGPAVYGMRDGVPVLHFPAHSQGRVNAFRNRPCSPRVAATAPASVAPTRSTTAAPTGFVSSSASASTLVADQGLATGSGMIALLAALVAAVIALIIAACIPALNPQIGTADDFSFGVHEQVEIVQDDDGVDNALSMEPVQDAENPEGILGTVRTEMLQKAGEIESTSGAEGTRGSAGPPRTGDKPAFWPIRP